jgi:two-component system, NarL family, invasion response regulator UvrY
MQDGLKILIADDHSVVRKGIIRSLKKKFPKATFCEASNSAEVLNAVHQSTWNLIILDVSMPGRGGIEILKEIKSNFNELPVVIFSMHPEDQFALRSLKAGASAYISKDVSSNEFEKIIIDIINGKRYFSPTLAELLVNELQNKGKQDHELLSDREYQVFMLISGGKNVSNIARVLNLSVKTVSVYRSNILKKMNLKNNCEMMHYAFKNKLVY